MANTKGKTNPSAAKLHNPNQAPNVGNDADYSREHIKGPGKSTEPTKSKKF
jgi:hypothetical protein